MTPLEIAITCALAILGWAIRRAVSDVDKAVASAIVLSARVDVLSVKHESHTEADAQAFAKLDASVTRMTDRLDDLVGLLSTRRSDRRTKDEE